MHDTIGTFVLVTMITVSKSEFETTTTLIQVKHMAVAFNDLQDVRGG
jgi:hypothetical protein